MHFPPELLRNIFIFSLPTRPSFRAEDAPMLLTHVCREWRDVALSTPALWSSVRVPSKKDAPKAVDALLALWLARAGNAPLDVTLNYYKDIPYYARTLAIERLREILRTLVPYRAQVRRMEGDFTASVAAHIGVDEMVNAEVLTLDFDSYSGPSVLDIGAARPSLRRLTVYGGSIDIDIRSVVVQPRLTHLFLMYLDDDLCPSVALQILVLMPTLEDVALQIGRRSSRSAPDLGAPKSDKCVELHALKTLHLWRTDTDEHLVYILDGISAPNLRILETYGAWDSLDGRDWTSLYNFLVRSQAPLQSMTLRSFSVTQRCLQACLACCPRLEELYIDCHTCYDDVVPAPPNLCDSDCAALARLLESRSGVVLEDGSSGAMRVTVSAIEC